MFADDIIGAVGCDVDRGTGDSITSLAESIRGAQRFIVKPDVLDSAWEVLGLTLTQQYRVLGVSQFPFDCCWFESSDYGRRDGILVETNGSAQHGSARCAVQLPDMEVPFAVPYTMTFDWRDEHSSVPGVEFTDEDIKRVAESDPELRQDSDGLRQAIARHGITPDPCLSTGSALPTKQESRTLRMTVYRGLQVVRAVLLLMNSRDNTQITPHIPSAKLQKARKRGGKAPLLDFTSVDISISRLLATRAASAVGDGRSPVRLHMVRRHPRVISKGVTWVRAHPRGSALAGVIGQQTRIINP
jgi:hypothetical protein